MNTDSQLPVTREELTAFMSIFRALDRAAWAITELHAIRCDVGDGEEGVRVAATFVSGAQLFVTVPDEIPDDRED